jgi:cytidine deaminase
MPHYIKQAARVALKSKHRWAHHGVLVLRGGAIVAAASNQATAHAEERALNKLWPNKRAGTTLISVRITPGGRLVMAKPCSKCMKLLEEAGVDVVYYTTNSGSIVRLRIRK